MPPELFAVIWCDFVPLSLPCASANEAIEKAQAMLTKAQSNNVTLRHLRAVRVTPSDSLVTLWSPES